MTAYILTIVSDAPGVPLEKQNKIVLCPKRKK